MRDRGDRAAEPEPVAGRNVALGDGDETRQPRFGGQQIVAVGVERALGHQIADREQLALAVEQKAEFHRQRHGPGGLFQDREPHLQASAASADGRGRGGGCRWRAASPAAQNSMSAPVPSPRSLARARAISAMVSAWAASSARRRRQLSPSDERSSSWPASARERIVELAPGDRLRSRARHAAGPPLPAPGRGRRRCRRGAALRSAAPVATPGRHWRARSGARPGCRCRPRRHSGGSSGRRSRVSYQL